MCFGLNQSPEHSVTFYYLAEEFIKGNHLDPQNPLRWDKVILNLIGNNDFDPAYPNVYKWDSQKNRIAGDLIAFIDDLRAVGCTLEHAWTIARWVASKLEFLGIQDAARKRRIDNGPWAGGKYGTGNKEITKTVTEEKWLKGKGYIKELIKDLKENKNRPLEYKRLERIRGFFCHLAMVYEILFPFLKGFHLTLAKHGPQRSEEGWKLSDLEWIGHLENKVDTGKLSREEADEMLQDRESGTMLEPDKYVVAVPRFHSCLKALSKVMAPKSPPVVVVRSRNCTVLIYGFADASGSGFGSTLLVNKEIHYRIGTWSSSEDSNSSNWREFENLVCAVEEAGKEGKLKGATVILATDNEVVEHSLYKGNSTSEKLFELVVRLRTAEIKFATKLLITHVSGKRMMAQGTDGVSRGSLKEGVALGEAMISFCPWGMSALETEENLKEWIQSWAPSNSLFLEPKDWFIRGHDITGYYKDNKGHWRPEHEEGVYIWTPPPAAADVCIEEIRKARMKRKDSLHIIIIQKLFTTNWLRQFNKIADCHFLIPPHSQLLAPKKL